MSIDNRPIGVFDSGVGGLTVLRAVQKALPDEPTIYLGDLARCPYGTRPQDEVREFALQIAGELVKRHIKLLVVACNTATAAAITDLEASCPVPVVGVIAPAASEAVKLSRSRRVGVIATDGTVASGAYLRTIEQAAGDVTVIERSASWLVPMIERGTPARADVARDLEPVLSEFRAEEIDVLILGCTHFPLVADIFQSEVGPGITILDSATTTARQVADVLAQSGLRSDGTEAGHQFLVTGPATAFAERAQTMFRASPIIETIEFPSPAVAPVR